MKFENKVFPNDEQLKGFADNLEKGPIKLLNLIKLKKYAEYNDGRETKQTGLAYKLYGGETQEHLKKVGAKVVFMGPVSRLNIGEVDELWDLVAIAEYPDRGAFLKMINDPAYQKTSVHREAAVEGQLNIEIL